MATTNRLYILAAFFFSATAAVFNIVSIGTEHWIDGSAVLTSDIGTNSGTDKNVNYGLFQGNYKRNVATSVIYQLTMTCSFKNNVCALLCGEDAAARSTLLDKLYNNNITSEDEESEGCPFVSGTRYYLKSFENPVIRADPNINVSHDEFINAGVWLCTLIFLILATLIGAFASVLALYNTVSNPIQYFLSVKSLFFYNAAAFCCTLLYMVLWGVMYNIRIFHNIGIFDTMVASMDSDKMTFLGYSYWISFIPLAFYCGSVGVLFYREYLNARDPKQQKVNLDVDSSDPNLYLY